MDRVNKAIANARAASNVHVLLDGFFIEQTAETIEAMKTCAHEELLDNRAYLLALEKLEQELLGYADKYNLIEVRRLHVRAD